MYISMNWISDYVDLSGIDKLELISKFSLSTAEVENEIFFKGSDVSGIVCAEIKSVEDHPESKKLHLLKVDKGDEVVDMAGTVEDTKLLTITETGYGRISPISDYRIQSRGGKGMTNYKTAKYGKVASVKTVGEDEDAILISSNGVIIRIYADSVSLFSRTAKGVRVMRADEGDFLYTMEITEHSEEAEMAEAPSAEDMADNAAEVDEAEDNLTADEALEAVLENAEEHPVEE